MTAGTMRCLNGLSDAVHLCCGDRYAISFAIARYVVSNLDMSWKGAAFISGEIPYDALGGGTV